MSNNNLQSAKKAKNDEFYTRREDIENELSHYSEHFKGKVVYCNCDDPEWSEFVKFFKRNFKAWGLKIRVSRMRTKNEGVKGKRSFPCK